MTIPASIAVNPLQTLAQYGQSVWLDYIRRTLISSGELQRLIQEDGLRGLTSNPAIFEKAIAGSTDYQDILADPASRSLDAKEIYEKIAVRDIQDVAHGGDHADDERDGGDGDPNEEDPRAPMAVMAALSCL